MMLTLREMTSEGLSKTKNREWNRLFREDDAKKMRAEVDRRMNTFFAAVGLEVRVDNRSREAQGLPRNLPHEPLAPRQDWQQFLREGARPEAAPITVRRLFEHRAARVGWERATAVAVAAEEEAATMEKQIAEIRLENARRIEAAVRTEAPLPRNNQQNSGRPVRNKIALDGTTAGESNMARKPTLLRKPSSTIEPWMRHGGGLSGLSPRLQASARTSYEEWSKAKPKLAARFDIENYVLYVQDKHAEERGNYQKDEHEEDTNSLAPATHQPNAIAPTSVATADERRRTHLQSVLAERYKIPAALETWCRRIEVDQDGKRAVLHGQGGPTYRPWR